MSINNETTFISFFELEDYGVPSFSRKHILHLQRTGAFPKSYQMSANRVAWRLSEIEAWVAARPIARALRKAEADAA